MLHWNMKIVFSKKWKNRKIDQNRSINFLIIICSLIFETNFLLKSIFQKSIQNQNWSQNLKKKSALQGQNRLEYVLIIVLLPKLKKKSLENYKKTAEYE